jgi:hypothetical protein
MALGFTQPLTELNTGGKDGTRRADKLSAFCESIV